MRELRTEIDIAAPLENVWKVLTDFEGWKDWNAVFHVGGQAGIGSRLNVTVYEERSKEGKSYPAVVTQLEAPRLLRWRARMMAGFIFTNDKIFELKKTEQGAKLIHREGFSGLMVPLMWKKMEECALPMLESLNQALKKKVEGKI